MTTTNDNKNDNNDDSCTTLNNKLGPLRGVLRPRAGRRDRRAGEDLPGGGRERHAQGRAADDPERHPEEVALII